MNFKTTSILLIMVIALSSCAAPIFFKSNKQELVATLLSGSVCGVLAYYNGKWADENYKKAEKYLLKERELALKSCSNNKVISYKTGNGLKDFIRSPSTQYIYYKYKALIQRISYGVLGTMCGISFCIAYINLFEICFPSRPPEPDKGMDEQRARFAQREEELYQRLVREDREEEEFWEDIETQRKQINKNEQSYRKDYLENKEYYDKIISANQNKTMGGPNPPLINSPVSNSSQ